MPEFGCLASGSRREPPRVPQWHTHEKVIHGFSGLSAQFVEKPPFSPCSSLCTCRRQIATVTHCTCVCITGALICLPVSLMLPGILRGNLKTGSMHPTVASSGLCQSSRVHFIFCQHIVCAEAAVTAVLRLPVTSGTWMSS